MAPAPSPAPYKLHSALGYQLSITARLLERRFEAGLKTLGLSRITWCVLLAAGGENLRHPSDIAAFIGIDRTATSRALRQLEAAGLIRRTSGRKDRRTTLVQLTGEGRLRLDRANPMASASRAKTEARLSRAERAELRHLLGKLRAGDDTPLQRL